MKRTKHRVRTLDDLKKFMIANLVVCHPADVYDWNDVRDMAKEHFSPTLINQLDSSGYIIYALRRSKRHTEEA